MTQNTLSPSPSKTRASKADFARHAVLTISQLPEYWEETGKVEKDKVDKTSRFLKGC